jgi:GNAT superfamily N-acetyltransferase
VTTLDGPRPVDRIDVAGFAALWTAVTRAGGAVGFRGDEPASEIRDRAAAVGADVAAGREHPLLLGSHDAPVGTVFLAPGTGPRVAHRAEVRRLMVHPDQQGRGLGRLLLDAAVTHAAGLGLEQLLLSARGGTTLPAFYAARGWTPVGVWPGALRLGPDDVRDEHWFHRPVV